MDKLLAAIQPFISLLKDLVTIASLSIAACVAIKGLQTWRHQLKGTANYECARRLVKAAYQLRDALQSVRNPFIPGGEFERAEKEMQVDIKSSDKDPHTILTAAVYQMRWKPVVEAARTLELEVVEAETIWGPKVKDATAAIWKSVNTLNIAISIVLEDMQSQSLSRLDKEGVEAYRQILYSISTEPEKDPFLKELNPAIKAIEELARPYLAR